MPGIGLFKWVLQTSIMAGVLVIFLMLLNSIIRDKLGMRWNYFLWLLVVVRLLLPFSFGSIVSIYNLTPVLEQNAPSIWEALDSNEKMNKGVVNQDDAGDLSGIPSPRRVVPQTVTDEKSLSLVRGISPAGVLELIWFCGAVIFGGRALFVNIRFWRIVRKEGSMLNMKSVRILEEARLKMKVYTHIPLVESNHIQSPALFGFVRPKLLMPKSVIDSMSEEELLYIMQHELAHMKQKDIAISWLTMILQTIHWFNPLIWYAFYKIRQAREISCDMIVLSRNGAATGAGYGKTLIKLAESYRNPIRLSGLAGISEGAAQIKKRLLAIKSHRPMSWLKFFTAAAISLFLLAVSLTDPLPVGGSDLLTWNNPSPSHASVPPPPPSAKSSPSASPPASSPPVVPGFQDENLELAVRELVGKREGDLTMSDIDSVDSLTLIGPYINEGLGKITGFSPDAYYDNAGVAHSEEGNIRSLADIAIFKRANNLEVTWQANLDPFTLVLPENVNSLRLRHDKLTDISFLSGCEAVNSLHLDYNSINDIGTLTGLKSLDQLSLACNNISDISPLTGLTRLGWLDISNNPLSDLSPLSNLKNLRNLYACNINSFQLSSISGLAGITDLNIAENGLTSLAGLEGLTNLKFLSVSGNNISDISVVEGMNYLEFLDLSGNPVEDISVLLKLPSLKKVILFSLQLQDDTAITKLKEKGIEVVY